MLRFALLAVVLISGCSARSYDAVQRYLSFAQLTSKSSIVLVSNSTTERPKQCELANSIVIEKGFPPGNALYCRDKSTLDPKLRLGPVCPAGNVIQALSVSSATVPCSKLTVCGVAPSAIEKVGTRGDGGEIERLTFTNLPWGCNASVDFSFDPNFSADAVHNLDFYVQPSGCPFCERQNIPTCEACVDLTSNEVVHAGQVVDLTCPGGRCNDCRVIGKSDTQIAHGQGYVYFRDSVGVCSNKCSNSSMVRMCNNGYWEGDPAYSSPQCIDTPCGCDLSLTGGKMSFAHGASTKIYKSSEPACGVECESLSKIVSCNDGVWQSGSPASNVTQAELQPYRENSCHNRICNCARPGRTTIADGFSAKTYSKDLVSCTETCDGFAANVQCSGGTLTGAVSNLFDSCSQVNCGCPVPVAGGAPILLANDTSKILFKYAQNSLTRRDACSNPANKISVTCHNGALSPSYDSNIFNNVGCTQTDFGCSFVDGAGNTTRVPTGGTIRVSATSTPACGVACVNTTLTCTGTGFVDSNNVVLSASQLATYKSGTSCTPKNCDCSVNGNILPLNQSDTYYTKDKMTECVVGGCARDAAATLTCTADGLKSSKADNPAKYLYSSCEDVPCGCSLPWGGSLDDSRTMTVYKIQGATCATPNACELPANILGVTCNNGNLNPPLSGAGQYPTCNPPVCSCSYGGIQTPAGQSLAIFKAKEAPPGLPCSVIGGSITCQPGGVWSGSPLAEYPEVSCTDYTDSGAGGGTGGGTGNDEGPGAGIRKRVGAGDGGGGPGGPPPPCTSLEECRVNGTGARITPFNRKTCLLPWGGGEVEFYSQIAAFDTQCVSAPGDRCAKHQRTRLCHFPNWSGSAQFKYPSCVEKSSCP